MSKNKFEVKTDKDGYFYAKKVVKEDKWVCEVKANFKGTLVKPKDTTIKATLSVDKVKKNFTATTGKTQKIGPFPVNRCDCVVELEGTSDTPNETHVFEAEAELAL